MALSWTLLKALSAKAGQCARLEREVCALLDDRDDLLLRYNRLLGAYSKLHSECMKTEVVR